MRFLRSTPGSMSAPSRSRIPIIIAATLATALLSACDEPAPLAAAIRPIRVVKVEPLDIGQALSQTGEIQPRYETDLGFRIGGQILARPVDVASVIGRGDLLARLDDQRARS
jgi:multidrug efflux system membrane fusion protein